MDQRAYLHEEMSGTFKMQHNIVCKMSHSDKVYDTTTSDALRNFQLERPKINARE